MRRTMRLGIAALLVLGMSACSDDGYTDPPTGDANLPQLDGGDASIPDALTLPDRAIDPEGPEIQIQNPQPLAVVDGDQLQVTALITDPDGVDSSTVLAIIPGGDTFPLSRTGQVQNQFSGIVDLRQQPSGNMSIIVEAADTLENKNSAQVDVLRDTGPTVDFISPEDGTRYSGSVNLTFEVRDPNGVQESSITAHIGQVALPLVKQDEDTAHGSQPQWILYTSEIVFDDIMFDPALNGEQQVTVSAENIINSVSSESSVVFIVDDDGPTISVASPQTGEIVGGILTIECTVSDEAGVLETSVVAVFGHNSVQYEVPLVSTGGGPYVGSFDTSSFPNDWVFPSISIRAADLLNNESETGFLVALDNTPPICALDPPDTYHLARLDTIGQLECSVPFDPVGAGVPNHGDRVPQIFFLRARIEDRGNDAVGLVQVPLSLVDTTTTNLYVLDDTSKALVVDTDGDGQCDEINPALVPSTNPQTTQEVLVLDFEPIPVSGDADYRSPSIAHYLSHNPVLPSACAGWGTETTVPDVLCDAVLMDGMSGVPFFKATFYTVTRDEPAIYSLPVINTSSPAFCTGQQFDALANNISEGWTCAAVRAVDNVGNIGISKPLPFFVDYTLNDVPLYNINDAPDCTGTWNSVNQTADASAPCTFNTASQEFRGNTVVREE